MKNEICYLCGSKEIQKIHSGTRDNPEIDVLECGNCGLVFLSSFDHIKNGLYENSNMRKEIVNIEDWKKSTFADNSRRLDTILEIISNKDVLDFGCGKGGFLDLAKNHTHTIEGIEIDESVRDELMSQGYLVWKDLDHCDKRYDIITMFHVIEHLENPIEILMKCKEHLNKENGMLIIETPNANDALISLYQSDKFSDFSYWSPHIFLYHQENLVTLADKAGLQVEWVKQIQRYPLSNHLYWLAKGKPGGQNVYHIMNTEHINQEYERILAENQMCDTLMICLR